MHILIATDAQWVLNEIQAVFGSSSTTIQVVTNGRLVSPAVAERTPDIAILDMQVGSMGGMAITMDLRLDYSSGALPNVPILMLLDREADVHMARRSGANGWTATGLGLGSNSLSYVAGTSHGASAAMAQIDAAIKAVDGKRADLGAVQNRFQATIRNLTNISENVSAARSRIRDTDFAKETAELTRQQILQQTSTTVLAQANQRPQAALSLLG